jgi:hypothetical protein
MHKVPNRFLQKLRAGDSRNTQTGNLKSLETDCWMSGVIKMDATDIRSPE